MKRVFFLLIVVTVLVGGSGGCTCWQPFERLRCAVFGSDEFEHDDYGHEDEGDIYVQSGPPGGSVTYPYYTNRGPRDFLAAQPRGIGR